MFDLFTGNITSLVLTKTIIYPQSRHLFSNH